MRRGSEYIAGLRDGRQVFLDGEIVKDVTTHPAFAEAIRRIARVYDLAWERRDDPSLTHRDSATGERVSNMWLMPRSSADLAARRRTHVFWAEATYGLMGRTPDHVASVLTGFAGGRDVFDRGGSQFGENVARFYERARRDDLYIAYVIVPPQIDRSKSAAGQPEPFLYPGVVAERDGGIVVRGAQMIGTSAILADWIFLSYIVPLQAGDEDYALSIVLPVSSPGVRLYPRRPYATIATSAYDYPLSSRFDETDSLVVLKDVFVPWEQVFIYRNVQLCNAQFFETGAHLLANFQALVRFVVKLQFIAGLARRITQVHNIETLPPVQVQLGGDIAAFVAAMEALTQAAEANPDYREGMARPSPQFVYAGMSLQRRWIVDLSRALRELAGGAFISVPSSDRSLRSPETREDVRRYYRSATASAEERIKFLKLMWDLVGTEYAGRQLQYEMFYSAAQHVVDARVFRAFDWAKGQRLVERCLSEYGLGEDQDALAVEESRGRGER
jgi:4-hydroxyphenylacetate 3-monooxygenase